MKYPLNTHTFSWEWQSAPRLSKPVCDATNHLQSSTKCGNPLHKIVPSYNIKTKLDANTLKNNLLMPKIAGIFRQQLIPILLLNMQCILCLSSPPIAKHIPFKSMPISQSTHSTPHSFHGAKPQKLAYSKFYDKSRWQTC